MPGQGGRGGSAEEAARRRAEEEARERAARADAERAARAEAERAARAEAERAERRRQKHSTPAVGMSMIGIAPPPFQRQKDPPPPSPAGAGVPDPVEEGLKSLERWRKTAEYAEEGASVSDVMRELREDEDDEDYEDKVAVKTEMAPTVKTDTASEIKTAAVAEVKVEPTVKGEPEPSVSSPMGQSGLGQPYGQSVDYGYGYGMYADEEDDYNDAMEEPIPTQRGPSGFITRYTGPEARRTDRPAFGWSRSAQHSSGKAPEYGGWSGNGGVMKSPTKPPPPMKKLQFAGAPAGYSKPHGGGVPLQSAMGPTVSRPPVASTAPPAPTTAPSTSWRGASGLSPSAYNLSTMVSHAVKVLPMFHSDTATVEKARDFWELFEDHTDGFPDRSRLLVFRQKLRGREADRWWNNSRIKSFRTLKVRFHNQFLSRTADELWELLENTKRQRGESVEEWGDRVSDLCESLDYPNPQMRYQLFRRGLRNKRMLATLDASPASDIPVACEWLMFKDMHRPIEEDDEFSDGESMKKKDKSEKAPATTAVEALTEQMKNFMEQQQQWQQQLVQRQWQPPRSPRNRAPVVAATPATQPVGSGRGQGNAPPFRGIRMGDDSRTQDGSPVCGRCNFKGHGRATCKRASMSCRRCGAFGHIAVECDAPQNGGGQAASAGGAQVPSGCVFCHDQGHSVMQCPVLAALREATPALLNAAAQSNPAPRQ